LADRVSVWSRYIFENSQSKVIVAVWLADAEFGRVDKNVILSNSNLNAVQLRDVVILDTFGNTLNTENNLSFRFGREVVYVVFRSGALTVAQARDGVVGMLAGLVNEVGGSQEWPGPFW
jgi:hypothetical protein